MTVIVRRPTNMGTNVDVHVPKNDEEQMKAVLRRVLHEARSGRGKDHFADQDAQVAVNGKTQVFTAKDDINQFTDDVVQEALK